MPQNTITCCKPSTESHTSFYSIHAVLTSMGTLSYKRLPITVFPWMSIFSLSSIGSICTSLQSMYSETAVDWMLRAILCQLRSKRSLTRALRKTTLTASLVSPTALYSTALFSPSRRIETWKETEVILPLGVQPPPFSCLLSIATDTPKTGIWLEADAKSRGCSFGWDMKLDRETIPVLVNRQGWAQAWAQILDHPKPLLMSTLPGMVSSHATIMPPGNAWARLGASTCQRRLPKSIQTKLNLFWIPLPCAILHYFPAGSVLFSPPHMSSTIPWGMDKSLISWYTVCSAVALQIKDTLNWRPKHTIMIMPQALRRPRTMLLRSVDTDKLCNLKSVLKTGSRHKSFN